VIAIDTETGKQTGNWLWMAKHAVLAVSDGHLVVSTTKGRVHVFGEKAAEGSSLAKKPNFIPTKRTRRSRGHLEANRRQKGLLPRFGR
jgi:hypothetical protein